MNEQTKTMTQETQNKEDFIMLPTVDFCFKELRREPRERKNPGNAYISWVFFILGGL